MSRPLRIVVIAHARSGSNSLVEILRLHPDIDVLNEPFNEHFPSWDPANEDLRARVHDVASLDDVMDEIFATHQVVKILTYQLEPVLLAHLALRPDVHVILLRRRNLLEAAVSHQVAMQTAKWRRSDVLDEDDPYGALAPIAIDAVRELIGWLRDPTDAIADVLDSRADGRVRRLVYEDLHLAPREMQERTLDELWAFLGVPPCADPRVREHLDPASAQMGSAATYGRVPNIREINDACGSDETGWLSYLDDSDR